MPGVVVAVVEEVVWVPVPVVVPAADLLVVGQAVDLAVGQVLVPGRAPVAAQVPGRAWRSRRRVTG